MFIPCGEKERRKGILWVAVAGPSLRWHGRDLSRSFQITSRVSMALGIEVTDKLGTLSFTSAGVLGVKGEFRRVRHEK